jgi:hypothetical protein
MFCTKCGASNPDDSSFCTKCGTPVPAATSEPPPLPGARPYNAGARPVPEGVKGWSWGAFLLNWVWAIGNRTWWGLLAIIPYVGFGVAIWLGLKGREMAWQARQWDSIDHFNRVQKKWSQWGVGITLAAVVIGILAAIAIPAYQSYAQRAHQAEAEARLDDRVSADDEAPAGQVLQQEQAPVAPAMASGPAAAGAGIMSRSEFQQIVIGQSAEAVLARLGRPNETQDLAGMQMWYYQKKTLDPVTQSIDDLAQIMFENGVVQQVSFM